MRVCIYIVALFVLASCTSDKSRQYQKDILGDWKEVRRISKPVIINGSVVTLSPPPQELHTGFSFLSNRRYENHKGFFKRSDNKTITYVGKTSKYAINDDDLSLFDPVQKNWINYSIYKLSADSLILGDNSERIIYTRLNSKTNNNQDFDRIILSTSGCYGSCPVMNISIANTGMYIFQGTEYTTIKGLYQSSLSSDLYNKFANGFSVLLDSVKPQYSAHHTDDETITTTFVKDGHIIKTVQDYSREAPAEFALGYIPLRYSYQSVKLKAINTPTILKDYRLNTDGIFKRGSSVMDIYKSEMFLLYDYLTKGKITAAKYDATYKLQEISTDGRFYSFPAKDGSKITIDIGFNFVKDIEKLRSWRKATEYD